MGLFGSSSSSPTVGIDIGSTLIKAVEAKPGKSGVQITGLGIAPTPPGCIESEIIVDPRALGQAIRNLLSESGISCRRSVSSVGGQSSVIVRIVTVPKMDRRELAETMKWEVERYVPFPADQVVMDFAPIEQRDGEGEGENMEVLLAVAQEAVVNRHVEALLAAGLQPVAIDVEPLAVARALVQSGNLSPGETVAVIDIGAATSELGIYRHGQLAFPRTLPIAGNTITRAISDVLHITPQQAERVKREQAVVLLDRDISHGTGVRQEEGLGQTWGQPSPEEVEADSLGFIPGLGYGPSPSSGTSTDQGGPDFDIDIGGSPGRQTRPGMAFDLSSEEEKPGVPMVDASESSSGPSDETVPSPDDRMGELPKFSSEEVFEAISPVLNDLIAEIRRSLDYFMSRYHVRVDRMVLCGGTAGIGGFDKLLESELGIPVTVGNPLAGLAVVSRSLSEGYLREIAPVLPVSVGLAIRDMIGE